MQRRPVEIRTPTHRNLIGRSKTACVIAQQYSSANIASPLLCPCKENSVLVLKIHMWEFKYY